ELHVREKRPPLAVLLICLVDADIHPMPRRLPGYACRSLLPVLSTVVVAIAEGRAVIRRCALNQLESDDAVRQNLVAEVGVQSLVETLFFDFAFSFRPLVRDRFGS